MLGSVKRFVETRDIVQGIAISPDGESMATIEALGRSVEVFTKDIPPTIIPPLKIITDPSIVFLDNRTLITFPAISSPPDTLLDVWSVAGSQHLRSLKGDRPADGFVRNQAKAFCLSGNGKTLATLASTVPDRVLSVTSIDDWKTRFVSVTAIGIAGDPVISISCSPNGTMIALGSVSGVVFFVNTLDMRLFSSLRVYDTSLITGVNTVAISPDGSMVAIGPTLNVGGSMSGPPGLNTSFRGVKVWRIADHALVSDDRDAATVRDLNWSSDSTLLGIARDNSVTVINAHNGQVVARATTNGTTALKFLSGNRKLVFGNGSSIDILQISK